MFGPGYGKKAPAAGGRVDTYEDYKKPRQFSKMEDEYNNEDLSKA